jgi:hypothetical protein
MTLNSKLIILHLKHLLVGLCIVILSSCEFKHNQASLFNSFIDKTCRAITLREQRYSVADQIRKKEDSLLRSPNASYAQRLEHDLTVLNKTKNLLLAKSLSLADSISSQIDSLKPYTDKQTLQNFANSLNDTLTRNRCTCVTRSKERK